MSILAATFVLAALAQNPLAPDAVMMPEGFNCADAYQAEQSFGSRIVPDGPYDPKYTTVSAWRKFRGDDASLIYTGCVAGSPITLRVISIEFKALIDAQRVFDRYRGSLVREFGAPCWDPNALSPEQSALLPDHDLSNLGWFRERVDWNTRIGVNVNLLLWHKPLKVQLFVISLDHARPIASDDLIGKIYNMSTCALGTAHS